MLCASRRLHIVEMTSETQRLMARQAGPSAIGMREIARVLWVHATPFAKRRLAAVLLLVIAAAVLTAMSPVALKYCVDVLAGGRRGHLEAVLPLAVPYVLSLWLARTADGVRELVFARARQRIFRSVSEQLFSHVMHLPLRFHLDRQTGAISQTLDNGLEGLRVVLHHLVFTCVPVTVELITVIVVIFHLLTPVFLVLFCGALVCYLAAFGISAASINVAARRASAARIDATAVMTDGLLNYETVKYFTAEALVQGRVDRALERVESEWVGFYRQYAVNGLAIAAIFAGFLTGAVLCAVDEVQHARMTLGDFVLVNSYMLLVVRPVEMMGYAMQGLSHGVAMLEKLVQLLRVPTEPRLHAGNARVPDPGSLDFRDVSLSYCLGRPVLNRVSFHVPAGRSLGIVGPSGSGKSTIVRLLMRLLEPETGAIYLGGVPISRMKLQDLRRTVAVVPQDTVLFEDTVKYNIAVGRADATPEEIEAAAKVAQLHEFIMALPDRYDTLVGERGVKLSGGERQRVSIARAVLKSPKIFVFDEATSSLDSRTEQEILRSLRTISEMNTTLVIAHRLSTVVHADEIVVLENGEISESGTHQALLRRNGRYAALWHSQDGAAAA